MSNILKKRTGKLVTFTLIMVCLFGAAISISSSLSKSSAAAIVDAFTIKVDKNIENGKVIMTENSEAETEYTAEIIENTANFEEVLDSDETYLMTICDADGVAVYTKKSVTITEGGSLDVEIKTKVTVTGTVLEGGKTSSTATVSAKNTAEGSTDTYKASVDKNGEFSLNVYEGQTYEFTITSGNEAYAPYTFKQKITGNTLLNEIVLEQKKCNVTIASTEGGTLKTSSGKTASSEEVTYGQSLSYTVAANSGYVISSVTVDTKTITEFSDSSKYTIDIDKITSDCVIDVAFKLNPAAISIKASDSGAVKNVKNGAITVNSDNTITIAPDEGYHITKVSINGKDITSNVEEKNGKYICDLGSASGNDVVEVVIDINVYDITVKNNGKGDAVYPDSDEALAKDITVEHGNLYSMRLLPNDGYYMESISLKFGNNVVNLDASNCSLLENKCVYNDGTKDRCTLVDNLDNSYTLSLTNIKEDITVTANYTEINEVNEESKVTTDAEGNVKIDNDYFTLSFEKEIEKHTNSAKETCYILDKNAKITITPKSGYKVRCSKFDLYKAKAFNVLSTVTLSEINVKTTKWFDFKTLGVESKIKVVIDNKNPSIKSIANPSEWSNKNVNIEVTTSDEGGADVAEVRYTKTKADAQSDTYVAKASSVNSAKNTDDQNKYTLTVNDYADYYIWCYDRAGNKSDIKNIRSLFDNVNPELSNQNVYVFGSDFVAANALAADEWTNKNLVVSGSIADAASETSGTSGIKVIKYSAKGENDENAKNAQYNENKKTFEFDILNDTDFSGKYYIWAYDKAGNKSKSVTVDVNLDTSKPSIDDIQTDAINDNWSNKQITLSVNAKKDNKINSDEKIESGISELRYYYKDEPGNEQVVTTAAADGSYQFKTEVKEDGKTPVKTGKITYMVYYIDKAGNRSETKEITVGIDTKTPVISKFSIENKNDSAFNKVINFVSFGIFFNEEVEVTVYAEDVSETQNDKTNCSGAKQIILYGYEDGKREELGKEDVDSDGKAVFTLEPDLDKKLVAVAVDKVDFESDETLPSLQNSNDSIENNRLILEDTKPTGTLTCSKAAYTDKDGNAWYAENVDFSVKAGDEQDKNGFNTGLCEVGISINDEDLTKDINGKDISHKYYEDDAMKLSDSFKVNTSQAKADEDGSYKIALSVKDNAGNISDDISKKVYKDDTKPVINEFKFYGKGNQEADGSIVTTTNYGYFFSQEVTVEVAASDKEASSGLKSITYYTINFANSSSGVKSKEVTKNVDSDGKIKFTIPSGFKGQIYARATDNVGNVGAKFERPDGVIVEDSSLHSKTNNITFDLPKTEYQAENGIDLYASDVSVDVVVADTFSGIKNIEWSVDAPYDTKNNQSGTLSVDIKGSLTGKSSGWSTTKTDKNLVTGVKKNFVISNNSNDIRMTVKLTDRAGNTSAKDIIISIDKTKPVINVSYDNNTPDKDFLSETEYYNKNRTATITVKERNFDADKVELQLKNTDGYIPSLSKWTENTNSSNPDANMYTATILYDKDGDYTFDMDMTDRANNASDDIKADKFTIDKTIPTVEVVYDNNDVKNELYYKKARTATIIIKEHNFETTRFSVTGKSAYDGKEIKYPTVGSWSADGDTHKANVTFEADGVYTFDLDYTDKAGNKIEDFKEQEFCIDKTAPELKIEGVEDKSANNGKVAPTITYEDLNFDKENVDIDLKGTSDLHIDGVELIGKSEILKNGEKFIFENFKETKENDDLYALNAVVTDKAGNESKQLTMFSVNRFGSVYSFGDNIDTYRGKFVRDEVDVVVKETNVDELDMDSIEIKVSKNGTPSKLVKDKDFIVKDISGDEQWNQYQYTIKASVFEEDAKYVVSIYSKDKAGNTNDSTEESKEAELWFGIDKTNPIVISNNVDDDETYPVDKLDAKISATDNLVLDDVKILCNGKEVEYTNDNQELCFAIEGSTSAQNIYITAVDAAGNECIEDVEEFYVTTNLFIRWRNNTALCVATIVLLISLIGAVFYKLVIKKK